MSDNYSGEIDATDPQEPDYQTHFDKPIVMPDFEKFLSEDKGYIKFTKDTETNVEAF